MKKIGLLFLTVILISSASFAQQKWGHINSNDLLNNMPELKKVKVELNEYSKQLDAQVNTMFQEYQTKLVELQQNGENLDQAVQDIKVKELQDMEKRIKEFQNSAAGKLASKEIEMLQPVMDKIQLAIKDVSENNDYTYILDTSSGAILYWPEDSYDIMPLVKQKLGI